MFYLLTTKADDGRVQLQIFEDLTAAENRFFRLFAAVVREYSVECDDGGLALIISCTLHEVDSADVAKARDQVKHNKARPLYISADPMCGPRIIVEGLFKTIH